LMSVKATAHDIYEIEDSKDEFQNTLKYDSALESYELGLGDNYDDEEIDEDDAFDDNDEKIFGNYFTGKKRKRESDDSDEIDLNENDENDDDIFMNLSDALDVENDDFKDNEIHSNLIDKLSNYDKRKMEKTEAREENEFNINSNEKVSLNDLLSNVSDQSEYSGFRKQMERLARAKKKKKN